MIMLDQARQRTQEFQTRLKDAGIDVALITDESSIAYLAGFWGYLSVEFGRPTFLLVRPDQEPVVITPLMESEMVSAMTWVDHIETWEDAGENRWEKVLNRILGNQPERIGVEASALPPIVRNWFDDQMPGMTGVELLQRIRQQSELHHFPAILLSLIDKVKQNKENSASAFSNVLLKPARRDLLAAAIANALRETRRSSGDAAVFSDT